MNTSQASRKSIRWYAVVLAALGSVSCGTLAVPPLGVGDSRGYIGLNLHATIGVVSRLGRIKTVVLDRVDRESPAERAGLLVGDSVLRIDGQDVRWMSWREFCTLIATMSQKEPGEKITLEVTRAGLPKLQVDVVVGTVRKQPNKAPEPTRTAVTPRAMEMKYEKKKSTCESNKARVAPAVRVAHL
jgi:hypothetical protein